MLWVALLLHWAGWGFFPFALLVASSTELALGRLNSLRSLLPPHPNPTPPIPSLQSATPGCQARTHHSGETVARSDSRQATLRYVSPFRLYHTVLVLT
jgi:hypothetical protein